MTLMPAVSSWLQTTRSRLTLLFGGTAVLAGLAIGLVADQVLTRHLTELSGQSLVSASQPIALALAQGMQEREREIALLSYLPMLTRDDGYAPQLQAHLEQIRQSYPFYSWIGVTDAQGVVQVSTGNLLRGQNVSQRPWFSAGQQGPYVGDALMRCCWINCCAHPAARCLCGSWTMRRPSGDRTRYSKAWCRPM